MRRDSDSGRDEQKIFNDVLTFKRRDHKSAPRDLGKDKERQKCRDHMGKEQKNDNPFKTADQKEDADKAFKDAKENDEDIKAHERHRSLKEMFYERRCRAYPDNFQKPEPEKNHKKTAPA